MLDSKRARTQSSSSLGGILAGKWEVYPTLKPSSFGLLLPHLFLVGACVCVLILSLSLFFSLISHYTKLYATWLSDPRWYQFCFNWCNCYCYSFPIPLSVALAQIWSCREFSLRFMGASLFHREWSRVSPVGESEWPGFSSVVPYDQETEDKGLNLHLLNVSDWLSISCTYSLLSLPACGTYRPYLNI